MSGTSAKLSRSVVSFEAKTRERGRAENIGRQGFFSCGSEAAGRHSLPVGSGPFVAMRLAVSERFAGSVAHGGKVPDSDSAAE